MLVDKRTGQTPKVPASRFNIDAHYHPDRDRPGSFNVPGGYFLDGDPHDFDPSFFNVTPIEAQWLDPQQRRMLEVSYECLESAGLTLDQVSGSSTGVFVGSFTSDYRKGLAISDWWLGLIECRTNVNVGTRLQTQLCSYGSRSRNNKQPNSKRVQPKWPEVSTPEWFSIEKLTFF
jgi:acyl transferase domain-containing protein